MNNSRQVAFEILKSVITDKHTLNRSFENQQLLTLDEQQKSLCKNLCFGVMREYFILDKIVTSFLQKPLKDKDTDLRIILFLGVFQLYFLRIPDHASINETVNLVTHKTWAKNLINAVLRNAQRNIGSFSYDPINSHPKWLIQKVKQNYPESFTQILTANQQIAPMSLRLNLSKISREDFIKNSNTKAIHQGKACIVLEKAVPATEIFGFTKGYFYVQDFGFQYACQLLDLESGHRVLDNCAAPGGKTTHMFEIGYDIKVTALDISKSRLSKIEQNLNRLNINSNKVKLTLGDATLNNWWDGEEFDRILCDVPCSATGIIKRQPDVKYLRTLDEINQLIKTQAKILQSAWQMLKPGGILLYATCSILPEENEVQIKHFLSLHPNAKALEIKNISGKKLQFGVQALPTLRGELPCHDGFYYAKLQKPQ